MEIFCCGGGRRGDGLRAGEIVAVRRERGRARAGAGRDTTDHTTEDEVTSEFTTIHGFKALLEENYG